jgi:hypothetical protein
MDYTTGLLTIDNFTYTYDFIENLIDDIPVYPSMYDFMARYIIERREILQRLQLNDPEEFVWGAYYKYIELPIEEKIKMHEQELADLEKARLGAEEKEHSAMSIVLSDEDYPKTPFDPDSPIHKETMQFMRGLVTKYRKQREEYERRIYEENNALMEE